MLRKLNEIITSGKNLNLSNANLRGLDLSNKYLKHANFNRSDLSNANLSNANLNRADLSNANLRGAILIGADLRKTDLNEVEYDYTTAFFTIQCPEEGSFIGYKKVGAKIVKLLILEDSKRSSATSRKCRCDKVKVLSVESLDGKEKFVEVKSDYDSEFIYKVGEIVKVNNFCEDRWQECAAGIHFFITKQEAINY